MQQKTSGSSSLPLFLVNSTLYGIERTALEIVTNSTMAVDLASVEKCLIFVRGQLCAAALAEPGMPQDVRAALLNFQGNSLRAMIAKLRANR